VAVHAGGGEAPGPMVDPRRARAVVVAHVAGTAARIEACPAGRDPIRMAGLAGDRRVAAEEGQARALVKRGGAGIAEACCFQMAVLAGGAERAAVRIGMASGADAGRRRSLTCWMARGARDACVCDSEPEGRSIVIESHPLPGRGAVACFAGKRAAGETERATVRILVTIGAGNREGPIEHGRRSIR